MSGAGGAGIRPHGGSNAGGAAGESSAGAAGEAGEVGLAGMAGVGGEGGTGTAPDCSLGEKRQCSKGGFLGSCGAGTQSCLADGRWSDCDIQPKAKDACTPGNDDNCNGIVNEGCPCVQGQQRSCSDAGLVGPCAAGKQTCGADAMWGPCSIAPAASDTCVLGNNDNCSGPPNEGCLCIEGVTTRNCGVCQDGTQTCTNGKTGQYGACSGGSSMTTYYLDADGDGHAVNTPSTVCGPAPAHYIVGPVDDCYDANKDVFPGQTKFFTTQRGDGSFDYNCDGKSETSLKVGDVFGCSQCGGSQCGCVTPGHATAADVVACGTNYGTTVCYADPACNGHGVSAGNMSCR